jgi:hypothetical protein
MQIKKRTSPPPGETERKKYPMVKTKLYCRSGAVHAEIKQKPSKNRKASSRTVGTE